MKTDLGNKINIKNKVLLMPHKTYEACFDYMTEVDPIN